MQTHTVKDENSAMFETQFQYTLSVRGWRQIILNCNIDLLFIHSNGSRIRARQWHDKICWFARPEIVNSNNDNYSSSIQRNLFFSYTWRFNFVSFR